MSRVRFSHALSLAALLPLSPGLAAAQDAQGPDQVEGRNDYLRRALQSVAAQTVGQVAEVMTARGKHLGYGVVIDGFVLTSNAILTDGELTVRVAGSEHSAAVAGRDLAHDVALLRAKWGGQPPRGIALGSSKEVPIGEFVYVGGSSATTPVLAAGVVSARNRRVEPSEQQGNILFGLFSDGNNGHQRAYPDVVHHDAPLAPEHFGAPLLDTRGRLLGINVANPYRGSSHAVSVDAIVAALPDLKAGVNAAAPARPEPQPERPQPQGDARGWLGISAAAATPERLALDYRFGVEVRGVEGPAKAANLQVGDVIVALDGQAFGNIDAFAGRLGAHVDTLPHDDLTTALFSESSGRLIVEVRPRSLDAFMKIMGRAAFHIGAVTDDSLLSIAGVEPIPVDRLSDAFNHGGER